MGEQVAFWLLSLIAVGSALGVIFLKNIFRAALLLLLVFFCVAGIFILLGADFLAGVQVLIYVGAVGILILMAIMLTREGERGSPFGRFKIPSALISIALLGMLIWAFIKTGWTFPSPPLPEPTTLKVGLSLFSLERGWVLPFEIASLLLLAAIIGTITLIRGKV